MKRAKVSTFKVAEAQAALDQLVEMGLAWKGADGRYRHIATGTEGRA